MSDALFTELVDATIVGVTVYPDRARITRRAAVRLPAGDHTVPLGPLPQTIDPGSVRVGGRGAATVLGVDVTTRHQPRSTDPEVAALDGRRQGLENALRELDDDQEIEKERTEFLAELARRAGRSYAKALAEGTAEAGAIVSFGDSLAEQLSAGKARQREAELRRELLQQELAAVTRELGALYAKQAPDRLVAMVALEVAHTGEVELELSYVATGASWESSYDVRLDERGDTLVLTWFGLVRQQTGEDWPETDLRLSTARPASLVEVPELDPWFLDRFRPVPPPAPAPVYGAMMMDSGPPAPAAAPRMMRAKVAEAVATVEQGAAAATYRPSRPVAVPADGSAHRAVVASLELPARLDYVTAPVRDTSAYLRATVTNVSEHTLLPGLAAVFHGGDFVGRTGLKPWAPGEELELALGVDDRVRVEREQTRRTATKAALSTTRRREAEYTITIGNHTPREARITVLDQLPVSRDEAISVRETRLDPAPAERTELGELTWRLRVPAGEVQTITFGFRAEIGKGVDLDGWRE
ncbi:mucoidy inhibitor MuiA family protein [Catenuloplanes sp. NPDC051500]|uniref:mucoidy inhibitor MuiA family protein n=1 Tax=Catenuloplanes sp. NPDC051500 TaxID=3363959 RepID=UPI003794EBB8